MTALLEYPFLTVLLEYFDLFSKQYPIKVRDNGPSPPPMLAISVGIFVNATILASISVGTLATTFTLALVPLMYQQHTVAVR